MPFPMWLTRVNKQVTNRLMIGLADRPPFAALRHRGRTSGREYRIPLNAFPRENEVVFALTYGAGTDWVKNVLADGRATLEFGGADIELNTPRLVARDEAVSALPAMVAAITKALGVSEYLIMNRAGS